MADASEDSDPARTGRHRDRGGLLTEADKTDIFRIATRSFVHWYSDRFEAGMTDDELAEALTTSLGIFGGSGGPDRPSVAHCGSGLRI
jgi:hypothetical protein